MNEYDLIQIHRLLQRSDAELEGRIIDLKSKYSIFRDFDALDLLELQELKFNLAYHRDFEQKLLQLCDYLIKYNKG